MNKKIELEYWWEVYKIAYNLGDRNAAKLCNDEICLLGGLNNAAFTIGNTHGYDKNLKQFGVITKLGKTDDYSGGWVWKSAQEAFNFINQNNLNFKASVYKMVLPTKWDTDVSSSVESDGVHRLINNAKIIGKIEFK